MDVLFDMIKTPEDRKRVEEMMAETITVSRYDLKTVLRCFGTLNVGPNDLAIYAARRLNKTLEGIE